MTKPLYWCVALMLTYTTQLNPAADQKTLLWKLRFPTAVPRPWRTLQPAIQQILLDLNPKERHEEPQSFTLSSISKIQT